jgi:hypothetical protein
VPEREVAYYNALTDEALSRIPPVVQCHARDLRERRPAMQCEARHIFIVAMAGLSLSMRRTCGARLLSKVLEEPKNLGIKTRGA